MKKNLLLLSLFSLFFSVLRAQTAPNLDALLAETRTKWAATDAPDADSAATVAALEVYQRWISVEIFPFVESNHIDALIAILPKQAALLNLLIGASSMQITSAEFDRFWLAAYARWLNFNPSKDELCSVLERLAQCTYFTHLYDSTAARYERLEHFLAENQAQISPSRASNAYGQLFYFYWGNQRNYEKAEQILLQRDAIGQGVLLFSALLYESKGDYDRAIEFGEEVLRQTDSEQTRYQAMAVLTTAYLQQNQPNKALPFLSEITPSNAVIFSSTLGLLPQYPALMSKVPENTLRAGRNAHLYFLAQMRNCIAQKDSMCSFNYFASISAYLEGNRNAQQFAEVAEIYASAAEAYWLLNEREKARLHYDTALAIHTAQPIGTLRLEGTTNHHSTLRILRGLMETSINAEQQQAYSDASLQTLDKIRRSLSSRGAKEIALNQAPYFYEKALALAFARYEKNPTAQNFERALLISDQSKSILLLESLKENNALNFGGVPDTLRRQEKSLTIDIALYEAEAQRAQLLRDTARANMYRSYLLEKRQQLSDLTKILERDYPKYHQIKHGNSSLSLAKIQQNLPDGNTALLEFFAGENTLYLFVISPKTQFLFSRPLDKNYAQTLTKFYELLTTPNLYTDNPQDCERRFAQIASELYIQLLLPQAFAKSTDLRRLIIIPDGLMSYVPLDLLLTEKPDNQQTFKSFPYLLRQYAVSYHYSSSLWLEARQTPRQSASKNTLLAFAPTYANKEASAKRANNLQLLRRSLGELTGTKAELEFLQQLFTDGSFHYETKATERQFKQQAGDYAVIHLAMHGLVDKENPMYSSMVFSEDGDSTEDNFLHAYELQNLPLRADLVVLSACETGYGKYQHGEGVVSIGRGFMYAGTPALVMTLWSINDQTSAAIMQLFYQNLRKEIPIDIALQQAKIDYLQSQKGLATHPNFWAAFVAVGDTQTVGVHRSNFWFWAILSAALLALAITAFIVYRRKDDTPATRELRKR